MINEQLQKKIDRAIRLLRSYNDTEKPIEVAYSGGKDSDVILQLAKEAGINYRAIYKNTTIDPSGTIKHAKEMGAEVVNPKLSFFKLIEKKGYPSRFARFCCNELKEYKILDKAIMGVRQSESKAREERYKEPTQCRFYNGRTKNSKDAEKYHVEAIYPIHDWTDNDVKDFILDRGITCTPHYYDENGEFHVERRLGCMACPLESRKKRVKEFKMRPKLLIVWLKSGQKYRDTHPHVKSVSRFSDVYEWFYFCLFEDYIRDHEEANNSLFGKPDYKSLLEEIFGIDLTI